MKKEEAIKIITSCAKEYKKNLENRNLLFLFSNELNFEYFEALFLPKHFLHLTGIDIMPKGSISSSDFYNMCLTGKLSPSSFELRTNGTTEMKLSILKQLMRINKSAKMVGTYNFNKTMLITDKIAGSINACMGFVKDGNYYVPNTALREDTRDLVQKTNRIVAICSKQVKENKYSCVEYLAKKFNIEEIMKNSEIGKLVDL